MSVNEDHFCVCITPDDLSPEDAARLAGHKAAVLNAAKWNPGDVISVSFLAGAPELRERVKKVAKEWTAPSMANLTLDFRNSGPTQIRIDFAPGKGSWSQLGTNCKTVTDQQKATMNYGWLTPQSSDDAVRRVVLHEFGHALGLIHEHQNPQGGISWNRDAVIRDLSGPPNNWSEAKIEHNMFKKYQQGDVMATDVDPNSIMMYLIPAAWTTNGFSADLNRELSQTDKNHIRSVYPR